MDVSVSLTSDEEDADLVLQVDMVDDDRRDGGTEVDGRWQRSPRQPDSRSRQRYARREEPCGMNRDISPRDMGPRDMSPQRYLTRQEMSMGMSDRYMDAQAPAQSQAAQLQMARRLLLEHHMRSHGRSMFPRGMEASTMVDGRPIDSRVTTRYLVDSTKQVTYNRPPEVKEPPKKAEDAGARVEWTLTHDRGLRVIVGESCKAEKKDEGKKEGEKKEGEEGEKKEGEDEKKEDKPEEKKEDKEGEKKEGEKKPEAAKSQPKVPTAPVTFEAKLGGGKGSVSIVSNEPPPSQAQYNVDQCSCYIDMLLGPEGCRECIELQSRQGALPLADMRRSYDTRGGYDIRDTIDMQGAVDMRSADMDMGRGQMDMRGGYLDRQCRHSRGGVAMGMRGGAMDIGRSANMEMEIRRSPVDLRQPSMDMRRTSRDFRPVSMDYRPAAMDYRSAPVEPTRATLEVRAPVDTRDLDYLDMRDMRASMGSGTALGMPNSMDLRRGIDVGQYDRRSPIDIQSLEIRAPTETRRMPSTDRRSAVELRRSLMYVRQQED